MELLQSSKPFLDAFNSLNSTSENNATTEDIKTVMRYMHDENNSLECIVDGMFLLGGAMFTTAIHYMVTRNIMGDPQAYAKKLESDHCPTKDFKSQADVKDFKAFLQQQCLIEEREASTSTGFPVSRKRLLEEFEQSAKAEKK